MIRALAVQARSIKIAAERTVDFMTGDVSEFIERVDTAAGYIRNVLGERSLPSVCVVLGSARAAAQHRYRSTGQ